MHTYCAAQLSWRPHAALSAGWMVTASPATQLQARVAELETYGQPAYFQPTLSYEARGTLGTITEATVVEAAGTFRRTPTLALGGLHPRQHGVLHLGGIRVTIALLLMMERIGTRPPALQLIVCAMLPRPAGGFRPSARLCSLYRVWTRLRVPVAASWMALRDRSCIACGPGRSPELAAWRRAVLQDGVWRAV